MKGAIILAPLIILSEVISPVNLALTAVKSPELVTLKLSPIVICPLEILQLPSISTVNALYSLPSLSNPIPIEPPCNVAPVTVPSLSTVNVDSLHFSLFCIVEPIKVEPLITPSEVTEPLKLASVACNLPSASTENFPLALTKVSPDNTSPLIRPRISASLAVNTPSSVNLNLGTIGNPFSSNRSFPSSSYSSVEYILVAIIVPPVIFVLSTREPLIVLPVIVPSGSNVNVGFSS